MESPGALIVKSENEQIYFRINDLGIKPAF
jgi:hypothetical protein